MRPPQLINNQIRYIHLRDGLQHRFLYRGHEDVRRLYERYQAAETDEERHKIVLETGKLDGQRHADIYAALEDE